MRLPSKFYPGKGAGVYSPEMYREKCSAMFEHMYKKYPERDSSVYKTC